MKKIKNLIKSKKAISFLLIAICIIVLAAGIFFSTTYFVEQQRYHQAVERTNHVIITEIKYELDNKKHELKISDFISSTTDGFGFNNVDIEQKFSCEQPLVFTADTVKTETFIIKTTIPDNKIWKQFNNIETGVNVSCVDTTPPEWEKSVDKITITQGDSFNIEDYFSAKDLSGAVVITTDKEINSNEIGTQTINVFATDKNNCVADISVAIIVEKKETATAKSTASSSNSKSTTKKETTTKANTSSKSQTSTKNKTTTTKPETTTQKPTTTKHDHSGLTGNMGKWFNSRAEVNDYYNSVVNNWNTKAQNGEITMEEYYKNCPMGYECWSCAECGKWTGNLYYR